MNLNLDLNDNSLLAGNSAIFNNGEPGRVQNVTVSIVARAESEPTSYPDYNFHYTDSAGAFVKDGYYKFSKDHSADEEKNMKNFRAKVTKLLSIAKSIVAGDYVFPSTDGMSFEQVEDLLLNTIKNNATPEKKVNVFVNYGTSRKPEAWLRIRYADFIEPAFVTEETTKLKVKKGFDNMERVMPDAPAANGNSQSGFGAPSPQPAQQTGGFWGGAN